MGKIKKEKSFERSYRPVVLWLDDLTELFAAVKERAAIALLATDNYTFETIEELKEHFGSQTQFALRIECSQPFGYIEFSRVWVKTYISPGPQSAQLFHDIDGILEPRQRKFGFLYNIWLLWPVLVGAGFLPHYVDQQVAKIIVIAQGVLAAWFFWAGFVSVRRSAVIRLQRRSEASPFFERNKDQLVLLLIGALVGGLVTMAVPLLKERVFPSAPT